jgi:hypothetical protein
MIKWYFGLTLKINALHSWVTRYSCYWLVCVSSVFWFWESSWLIPITVDCHLESKARFKHNLVTTKDSI